VTAFSLEQPGDIVNVADVQHLQLASMSLDDETWGIALMRIQANLPDTLPGQNVTFLVFGDVEITNVVENAIELPVTTVSGVNVRLQPTTNADNVITTLSTGQEVIANGRLADNSWIRIKLGDNDNNETGWVSASFLQSVNGDFNTLPVTDTATENIVELPVTATTGANVREQPTIASNNVIGGLMRDQEVIANGRLADNSWIRIKIEDNDNFDAGWVLADLVQSENDDFNTLAVVETDKSRFGPMQSFYFKTGIGDSLCAEAPDSGIIIQTPHGAGTVELTANGVNIALGSTVYLQTADDSMTVAVVEGQATITAQGVSQLVPAGSVSSVPLDENGIADEAPQFPQPYDIDALSTLPIASNLPQTVEITPPLSETEIEAEIQQAEGPFVAGNWTMTGVGGTILSADCPDPTVTPNSSNLTIEPSDDYSSFVFNENTHVRTGDNTYSFSLVNEEGALESVFTFTSPTTLLHTWSWTWAQINSEHNCNLRGEDEGTANSG
jgi:hypothetical protein